MKLIENTFKALPDTPPVLAEEMLFLAERLKGILTEMCGPPIPPGSANFQGPPKSPQRLRRTRDELKADYQQIWKNTTVIYEHHTYGASARHSTNTIVFGEFFLKTEIETLTLKKVLMHEFLHLAVDMPRAMHHGQINKIIRHHLGYHGDPNPLGTD